MLTELSRFFCAMHYLILLSIVTACRAGRGLMEAKRLIEAPVPSFERTTDRLLQNNINQWDEKAYKLHVLRTRIGHAWESAFTDIGFSKHDSGIDLIHPQRRLAIELKNGYKLNSVIKRNNIRMLKKFKREHPTYTVILGCINYKNRAGKVTVRDGVRFMYGDMLLRFIFAGDVNRITNSLRQSVRRYVRREQ